MHSTNIVIVWPRVPLAAIVAIAAALAGCNESHPAADTAKSAAVAATASAQPPGPSPRKAALEARVTEVVSKKGVAVKSATCSDDADRYTVRCSVVSGMDESIQVTCNGLGPAPTCTMGSAVLDSKAVAATVRARVPRRKLRGKVDVTCPEGPLVKAVGDTFYCRATAKTGMLMADVKVKELDGSIDVSFKSVDDKPPALARPTAKRR
jgi:hypothetical protein